MLFNSNAAIFLAVIENSFRFGSVCRYISARKLIPGDTSGMYVSDYAATGRARGTTLDTSVKSIVITAGVREICTLQKALAEQYLTIARLVISKRRFIRKALVR